MHTHKTFIYNANIDVVHCTQVYNVHVCTVWKMNGQWTCKDDIINSRTNHSKLANFFSAYKNKVMEKKIKGNI